MQKRTGNSKHPQLLTSSQHCEQHHPAREVGVERMCHNAALKYSSRQHKPPLHPLTIFYIAYRAEARYLDTSYTQVIYIISYSSRTATKFSNHKETSRSIDLIARIALLQQYLSRTLESPSRATDILVKIR